MACFHEAGHCLARWYFGYHTHQAAVLSVAEICAGKLIEDRRGRQQRVEGSVEAYDIAYNHSLVGYYHQGRLTLSGILAEIALVEAVSGIVAEARYTKRSEAACSRAGGHGDIEMMRRLTEDWLSHDCNAVDIAFRRARALVGSSKGWSAVGAVAARLRDMGVVHMDEIDQLCAAAYGENQPAFGTWIDFWPVQIEQIKRGYIPTRAESIQSAS